jgi:hypothetical protein
MKYVQQRGHSFQFVQLVEFVQFVNPERMTRGKRRMAGETAAGLAYEQIAYTGASRELS